MKKRGLPVDNLNVDNILLSCRKMFCNPGCQGFSKKPLRYVCPACKNTYQSYQGKGPGPITMCMLDIMP